VSHPDDVLLVVHRSHGRAVRLVLHPTGVLEVARVDEDVHELVDLVVERAPDAELGDRRQTWGAARLAAATRLAVGGARGLMPWGLPARSPVSWAAEETKVLRFHCTGSPFAGRPLALDLVADRFSLTSRPATGDAHLHVPAPWDSLCGWLTHPHLLFGDAFPDLIGLHGDLALLSMFEGLVWEATEHLACAGSVVQRWGRCWGSAAVRRDLATLDWPL
jgi:hypothetical protein